MPSPAPEPELSVIIPVRGNHPGIEDTLNVVRAAVSDLEILVVTDPATLGPAAADTRSYALLVDARVRLLEACGAKAAAVRHGLTEARGRFVAYLDADHGWEAPPDDLREMVTRIRTGEADCLVAQRDQHDWSRTRRAKTNTFIWLTHLLFRLSVRDTQTPLKVMTRAAAQTALAGVSWNSWAFDVELLHVLAAKGYRVAPHPVRWKGGGGELPWASAVLIVLMAPGMVRGLLAARLRTLGLHRRLRS